MIYNSAVFEVIIFDLKCKGKLFLKSNMYFHEVTHVHYHVSEAI